MNILVLSWRDPKHPLAGGAEQVVHEHCKAWLKNGHSITLFSSHYKGGLRYENLDGVKIIRFGYQLIGVHLAAFFWYLFGKHEKFDLVIDQFHGIPFFTPLYVREKKIAIIQEVAKEVWFLNHLPAPLNKIIGYLGYTLEPYFFWFYKKIDFMTGSESAQKDLLKLGLRKNRIKIINHGVIISQSIKKITKERKFTIVFLGALAKDKGIEDAIEAFSILDKKYDFNFWIIGKGSPDYKKILVDKIAFLGIKNKPKFFGFVSQPKKFILLSRAHLLINPSIREGWGLVNIEANWVGVPVIAYNSPGLTDSVKKGVSGLITKKNTPLELANNIEYLVENEKKFRKLQQKSKKWSEGFTWDKASRTSLNFIEKVYRGK